MKTLNNLTLALLLTASFAQADTLLPAKKHKCCVEAEAAVQPLSDKSIYQSDSEWTTDTGKVEKLQVLGGRPQVVVMFFASCEYACPVLVHDLKKIEAELPENLRGKVGFTLVSFDSERDTVAALAGFRKQHELDPKDWTLLRGKSDDVLELSALLGVKFKKDARGQFAHSNLITVLNAKGEIVKQISGLQQDPALAIEALKKLFPEATVAGF